MLEGAVFVTVCSHYRVDRYDPVTHTTATFTKVPKPPMGLAFDTKGTLWMTAGTLHKGPAYVYRVERDGRSDYGANFRMRSSSMDARCIRMVEPSWFARGPPDGFSRSIWMSRAAGTSGFREIGSSRLFLVIRGRTASRFAMDGRGSAFPDGG